MDTKEDCTIKYTEKKLMYYRHKQVITSEGDTLQVHKVGYGKKST